MKLSRPHPDSAIGQLDAAFNAEVKAAMKEEEDTINAIAFLVERDHIVDMDGSISIFKCSELAGDDDGKYAVHDESGNDEVYADIGQAITHYLQLVRTWTGK